MSDTPHNFHNFALKSSLFKGQHDWYFCFLKSERIAHVLAVLAESIPSFGQAEFAQLYVDAASLPKTICRFAAGEAEAEAVLATLFSLLSGVRLAATRGLISKENTQILLQEYQALVERFAASTHPSPFMHTADFSVPEVREERAPSLIATRLADLNQPLKDTASKGHSVPPKGQTAAAEAPNERASQILKFVQEKRSVSIKDISSTVRGCSEKTIQRELAFLIRQGLVRKTGERRWSQYLPVARG